MKKTSKPLDNNGEPTTRKRIGKLKTASDVSRYMARCIKRGEGGDSTKYYRQVMMASMLLKAIETSSLEDRITHLEKIIAEQGQKRWASGAALKQWRKNVV